MVNQLNIRKISWKLGLSLLLGKILNIPSLIIVTRPVFQEDDRYYPQDIYMLHEL